MLIAGVADLFDGRADLSGISGDRDLLVSDAIHKAVLEVLVRCFQEEREGGREAIFQIAPSLPSKPRNSLKG